MSVVIVDAAGGPVSEAARFKVELPARGENRTDSRIIGLERRVVRNLLRVFIDVSVREA